MTVPMLDAGAADGERGEMSEGDDDETGASPVGENGPAQDSQGGTGDEGTTLDAAAAPGDDTVVAGEAMAGAAEASVPSRGHPCSVISRHLSHSAAATSRSWEALVELTVVGYPVSSPGPFGPMYAPPGTDSTVAA